MPTRSLSAVSIEVVGDLKSLAIRGLDRGKTKARPFRQPLMENEPLDQIAEGASDNDIGWEVLAGEHAGKPDRRGHGVDDELVRHPGYSPATTCAKDQTLIACSGGMEVPLGQPLSP